MERMNLDGPEVVVHKEFGGEHEPSRDCPCGPTVESVEEWPPNLNSLGRLRW